jgi:hypothetical protein
MRFADGSDADEAFAVLCGAPQDHAFGYLAAHKHAAE